MKKIFADCAPAFWERGYSVLPIEPGSKRPAKEIKGWQGHCNGPPSVKIREEWLVDMPAMA